MIKAFPLFAQMVTASLMSAVILIPAAGSLDCAWATDESDVTWTNDSQVEDRQTTDTVDGQTTHEDNVTVTSHQTSSDGREINDNQSYNGWGDGSGQDHTDISRRNADGSTSTSVTDEVRDSKGNRTRTTTETTTDKDGNRTTTTTYDEYDSQGRRTDHRESTTQDKVDPPKPPEKVEPPKPPTKVDAPKPPTKANPRLPAPDPKLYSPPVPTFLKVNLHMVYESKHELSGRFSQHGHVVSGWTGIMGLQDWTGKQPKWSWHGRLYVEVDGVDNESGRDTNKCDGPGPCGDHWDQYTTVAKGSMMESLTLDMDKEGYTISETGGGTNFGTKTRHCPQEGVTTSEKWLIYAPRFKVKFPIPTEQDTTLSGSAFLTHDTPAEPSFELPQGNTLTIRWEFTPVGIEEAQQISKDMLLKSTQVTRKPAK